MSIEMRLHNIYTHIARHENKKINQNQMKMKMKMMMILMRAPFFINLQFSYHLSLWFEKYLNNLFDDSWIFSLEHFIRVQFYDPKKRESRTRNNGGKKNMERVKKMSIHERSIYLKFICKGEEKWSELNDDEKNIVSFCESHSDGKWKRNIDTK